nr:long-chain fatty acid--CoA ligase [Pseudooceanicola onchidii]
MLGLMQERPLLISSLLEHAACYHADREIVSRTCEGRLRRDTYRTLAHRSRQLAHALIRMGVKPGDRVASLAWNTHRHLELYYAVSGIGAVLHTVNPRLFPEQLTYIINHAGAKVVMYDITFDKLVADLRPTLDHVKTYVALTDADHMAGMPEGSLCYEDLLAAEPTEFDWPVFDENTASGLCYTSGTTGNPKGVLYSHRSTLLHAMMLCQVDGLALSSRDATLLCVPLFHVNAWGVPYGSPLCGAKLVLPGPNLDGKSLYELAKTEGCTFSLGVPTVWMGFLDHIEKTGADAKSELMMQRLIVGGSAAPKSLMRKLDDLGIHAFQAWGMSETGPVATVAHALPKHDALSEEARFDLRCMGGRPMFGVELRLIDDEGRVLAHDGDTPGELQVRGPWVTSGYFGGEGTGPDAEGWFSTGDIATVDPDGFVRITDRAKDVIKSGGEWISSIDLEDAAMRHPQVAEAAVVGVPHPRWQERPLLVVVPKGDAPDKAALRDFLTDYVARWWLPDDVVFVDELPHTATGKLQKMVLRKAYAEYVLPDVATGNRGAAE